MEELVRLFCNLIEYASKDCPENARSAMKHDNGMAEQYFRI